MITRPYILQRIIEPKRGSLSSEHARYILSLEFSTGERARFLKLSKKVQEKPLNARERAELDDLLSVNSLLMILQSKARLSLKKHNSAA